MVHGNIKPANIFIMKNETVKIGDLAMPDIYMKIKTTEYTPWYIAPEVSIREKYDSSADIYSLGCTIFTFMCLKNPFTARD